MWPFSRTQREKDRDRWKSIAAASVLPMIPAGVYESHIKNLHKQEVPADLLLDYDALTKRPSGALAEMGVWNTTALEGAEIDKLKSLVGSNPNVVVTNEITHPKFQAIGPVHIRSEGVVNIPSRAIPKDFLAHELTHSGMLNPGGINTARRAAARIPELPSLHAGAVGAFFIDPESNAQTAGLLGGHALLMAPRLAEEAHANLGAWKAMKALHAEGALSDMALSAAKSRLLRGMSSYAVPALAGLLGAAGIIAARRGAVDGLA